jgi:hypothetical protein
MSTGLPLFDAANPSLVHPPEIKSESPTLVDGGLGQGSGGLAETFRHSGWRRHRRLVYESLRRTMQSVSRICSFCSCGYTAFVYRSVDPPHAYRLAGSSCHDKFCTPCARDRSHTIAANVLKHLDGKSVRFATLTVKHNAESLGRQLDRLYAAFRRLRESKVWRRHVIGGAAFLEIKWIEASQSWHPHLHTIIEGRYFARQSLSAAWWKATGDSMVIDIRAIKDERKIAAYVAKYASKSVNDTFINRPECLDAAVNALQGRRLCLTFGTWRGLKLTASPSERAWEALGSFHDVCVRALSGDSECAFAIEQVCGSRAAEILDAVHAAIPPPMKTKPMDAQLFFEFQVAGYRPTA